MPDKEERFLIVVSILGGRSFPKRPQHKLIIDTKFDGELLSTDPVDHTERPNVTQELAWQLDRKGLQQHRLHRSSIKVQCYAYDTISTMKEMIGYAVLDLRSATMKQTSKWYPLLHSKYTRHKAEIQLGLYLDHDTGDEVGKKLEDLAGVSIKHPNLLCPVLNESGGYYQIGPLDVCKDIFILSVTIGYATNLAQLIPGSTPLPDSSAGYHFYYSLFGNNVTNESFSNLIRPEFAPERASVKIRSSLQVLSVFLSKQPGIQIHLCCKDVSLGRCEVPLNTLLQDGSTEIYMQPVVLDGTYQILPLTPSKNSEGSYPVVGVTVALRKEDVGSADKNKQAAPQLVPEKLDQEEGEKPNVPKSDNIEYSNTFEDKTGESISSITDPGNEKKAQNPDAPSIPPKTISPPKVNPPVNVNVSDSKSTGESSTKNHVAIPAQLHHFTFSIDLNSITGIEGTNTKNVFLRYVYPFFGSVAPILTHPTVEISKGVEVLLPHSFCAFDFACLIDQLQETFIRVPLFVEVWERDRSLAKDVLLGTGRLPLAQILAAEKTRTVNSTNGSGWRQVYRDSVLVSSVSGNSQKVASISVVLTMEDWGPIHEQEIFLSNHSSSLQKAPEEGNKNYNAIPPPEEPKDIRETREYQIALELEMWKEMQQQKFENELKQKEITYMKVLADEWKKRDKEREVVLQKKLSEYNQLEDQLNKALKSLEKRERELTIKEKEIVHLRNDHEREHERKMIEMKEASQRLQEDCEHRIQLERIKVSEMEGLILKYKQELIDAEKKYASLEKEISLFKEQQSSKPEVRLHSEINMLTLEKVELERKLDSVTKSKIHYKQQWGRALKELARLKQREQATAKAQLKRQQQELEEMRLRYIANEEKESMKNDKKELEEIKNELNRLRLAEEQLQLQQQQQQHAAAVFKEKQITRSPRSYQTPVNGHDEHITRLIEERDILLRTGVYTSQDRIIADLDQQIKEAISQRKS